MAVHQTVEPSVLTALSFRPKTQNWRRTYAGVTAASDATASAVAAVASLAIPREALPQPEALATSMLPALWVLLIFGFGGYDHKRLAAGYRHVGVVARTAALLVLAVALAGFVTGDVVGRWFALVGVPVAMALTLASRFGMARWLGRRQAKGQFQQRVLLVGDATSVSALAREMLRNGTRGWRIVGACVPVPHHDAVAGLRRQGIHILGTPGDVAASAGRARADVVAVAPGPAMAGEAIRRVGWDLERADVDVVVAPGLSEVSGERLEVRPVGGLALLRVAQPRVRGFGRAVKSLFDRSAALAGLLVLAPILLAIAAAVKIDSRGPAMFTQTRVGLDGRPFRVFKFRTMCVDAEALKEQIASQNQHGVGPLFKMRADPRITRVGARLRRWSLDELPQLINIVRGDMSLVGPRPALPSEVAEYEKDTRRRLLVKPGLTGLWQVSGRSDLDWEQSVRLDLRYVENWSLRFDLHILWRTARAVLTGAGAY